MPSSPSRPSASSRPSTTTCVAYRSVISSNSSCVFHSTISLSILQSRNPFASSKEQLVSIFNEVNRKWEGGEKRRLEERALRRKASAAAERKELKESAAVVAGQNAASATTASSRLRKEVWIRPGSSQRSPAPSVSSSSGTGKFAHTNFHLPFSSNFRHTVRSVGKRIGHRSRGE